MRNRELSEQNIMFVSRSSQYGGTEKVILQMCEILSPKVNNIVVCSNGNIKQEYLSDIGIKHYTIPDIENKSIITMLEVLKILSSIVENEKITIIHSNHRMAAFYAQILSMKYDFRKIATAHGIFSDKKELTRLAYLKTKIIACGNVVKKNLVEDYKLNEKNITVIHNAIRLKEDKLKEIYTQDCTHNHKVKLIGNIGRLSYEKGQEYYVKAIPSVLQVCKDVHFFIIGDGPDKDKLLHMVDELEIEEYVSFLGYREDIYNIISQLDLIVLSSMTEGLPLTPIEAFSLGVPVVATDVGGTIEIVKDGENGIIVPPKQSEEIAKGIINIITSDALRSQFSTNALDTYNRRFSYDVFRNNIISYYEGICNA